MISEWFQSSSPAVLEKLWAVPEHFKSGFRAVLEHFQSSFRVTPDQFQSNFRAVLEHFQSSSWAVPGQFQSGFRAVRLRTNWNIQLETHRFHLKSIWVIQLSNPFDFNRLWLGLGSVWTGFGFGLAQFGLGYSPVGLEAHLKRSPIIQLTQFNLVSLVWVAVRVRVRIGFRFQITTICCCYLLPDYILPYQDLTRYYGFCASLWAIKHWQRFGWLKVELTRFQRLVC